MFLVDAKLSCAQYANDRLNERILLLPDGWTAVISSNSSFGGPLSSKTPDYRVNFKLQFFLLIQMDMI